MTQLFAHSERNRKPVVRYLRGAMLGDSRYKPDMQLRIKELRKENGWTVEQLAEKVGLSKSYVSEIENGKKVANQTRIQKFADVFGVRVMQLLDPSTMGSDESALFDAFLKMKPEKRQALVTVAKSMADE